jgi:hypothetical protein
MQVAASIDMTHRVTVGKTRCKPLAGKTFAPGKLGEFVETYATWLAAGEETASAGEIGALREQLDALGERKAAAVAELRSTFKIRRLEQLLASQVDAAATVVVSYQEEQ